MKLQKIALLAIGFGAIMQVFAYQISITEPAESRAYHRPAQSIEVVTSVTPALNDGASMHIMIGDVNMGIVTQASLPTLELDPGAHDIKVIVTDKNGQEVATAQRTIYVIQNTPLQRARREQQQNYENYQSLPWYQKMLLNLRPGFEKPQPVEGVPPAQ